MGAGELGEGMGKVFGVGGVGFVEGVGGLGKGGENWEGGRGREGKKTSKKKREKEREKHTIIWRRLSNPSLGSLQLIKIYEKRREERKRGQ